MFSGPATLFLILTVAVTGCASGSSGSPKVTKLPDPMSAASVRSSLLAQAAVSIIPEVRGWATRQPTMSVLNCDSSGSSVSASRELRASTKISPRILLKAVLLRGPAHGYLPDTTAPVTVGPGLQLNERTRDGYNVTITAYDYGLVRILVQTPCLPPSPVQLSPQ